MCYKTGKIVYDTHVNLALIAKVALNNFKGIVCSLQICCLQYEWYSSGVCNMNIFRIEIIVYNRFL